MKFSPEKPKQPETEKFSEQAIAKEKGALEKFSGKTKEIAGILMLISLLGCEAGQIQEIAENQKKESASKTEKEKTPEEKAVAFLDKLYKLPNYPSAVNPAHNELLKERAARIMIEALALSSTEAISSHVSPEDIQKTLKELMSAQVSFADQVLGNNNGKSDPEEMAKLNKASKTNAGMRALNEMFLQFAEK